MPRLNPRAFEILITEVKRLTAHNVAYQVQYTITLKRLEKLRMQEGQPASVDELRATLCDIFPTFDEKVLKAAAKANQAFDVSGVWHTLKFAAVTLIGMGGSLYILNLPFPMIRRPVAQVAPIVLLPSYLSMDYHYRQAIALVEQADQLVNQASSSADFDLGSEKVEQAQRHLDALPVWFLGYEPYHSCAFFSCRFMFTLDEFRTARAQIGRMEATLFQEKNAQTVLAQGETALTSAKQQYQQAQTQPAREQAIAAWQAALDSLQQIPAQTLAGRSAQTKLVAYQRDFEQVASVTSGRARSNTLIDAAKAFASAAAQASQNPPHTAAEWGQMAALWDDAIDRLQQIPLSDPGYGDAQVLLVTYKSNRGTVQNRLQTEQASVNALVEAKDAITRLVEHSTDVTPQETASHLQRIINQLTSVKSGTTAYTEAQSLLQSAEAKLKQLPAG